MEKRPEVTEYNPYYSRYVNLIPEGDLLYILKEQVKETNILLKDITHKQAHFRYAPDKWSLKEVIGHLTDTERIMGYRLLCIARGETVLLPGYDDKMYVLNASFNRLPMHDLLGNFHAVRQSTLHLLKSLDQEAWMRRGNANGSDVSVRAIACIIAGHELHHRQIIKERYMGAEAYPTEVAND
jgi:hypothetical protein